jgi:hypothetical protein
MNQELNRIQYLLLVPVILIISCIAPFIAVPSVPTSDPEAVNTIIAQTVAAASTQTAMARSMDTARLTVSPTISNPPAPILSSTSSLFTPLPTLGPPTLTATLSLPTKTSLATRTQPLPPNTPLATRTVSNPTGTSSATLSPPILTNTPITPSATATATPCPSAFSCDELGLPTLSLPAGGPNNRDFMPCSEEKGFPWISVETEKNLATPEPMRNDLEQGQRAYYFACEFPDKDHLSAEITSPDGYIEPLPVLTAIPNPELQMHNAQKVVVWNAARDLKTDNDTYTLTMQDDSGNKAQLTFFLRPPAFQRILTVPYQSGPAGTTFWVYYCGYGARAGQNIIVDFYYGVTSADPNGWYDFYHTETWDVFIDSSGCVMKPLTSLAGDPIRIYLIKDREPALKGSDYIWLTP